MYKCVFLFTSEHVYVGGGVCVHTMYIHIVTHNVRIQIDYV